MGTSAVVNKVLGVIHGLVLLPKRREAAVCPPLIRNDQCAGQDVYLDDRNEGGSTSIIHNNHKRLCGAPFYPPKDPMPVHHPPTVVFTFAEFTLINLYNLSGPSNGNGVVQEVLGTDIPNKIKPVNGHPLSAPNLLRCVSHPHLFAPKIEQLNNNVEFQMATREEAVVFHACESLTAFGRAPPRVRALPLHHATLAPTLGTVHVLHKVSGLQPRDDSHLISCDCPDKLLVGPVSHRSSSHHR